MFSYVRLALTAVILSSISLWQLTNGFIQTGINRWLAKSNQSGKTNSVGRDRKEHRHLNLVLVPVGKKYPIIRKNVISPSSTAVSPPVLALVVENYTTYIILIFQFRNLKTIPLFQVAFFYVHIQSVTSIWKDSCKRQRKQTNTENLLEAHAACHDIYIVLQLAQPREPQ